MLVFVTKKTNSEELAKNLREKGHERRFNFLSEELFVGSKHKIMRSI